MQGSERGAGSVLVVAVVGSVVALTAIALPLCALLPVAVRADGTADAAALAAADTALGVISGVPCERATSVAAAMGATVERCVVTGLTATVRVRVLAGVVGVTGTATAGLPPLSRNVE